MGLGKTLEAIGTAVLKKQILGFKKTLVVCPATLKSQWKKEIEKFTHVIKDFFINYYTRYSDITVDMAANSTWVESIYLG
ncbi:MAG: hypothetical protein LBP74_09765 [Treponema sp.]|jgi:SNF2 family DNA or RNA helicase|nr:hypothetical protein [Treponema sp.]